MESIEHKQGDLMKQTIVAAAITAMTLTLIGTSPAFSAEFGPRYGSPYGQNYNQGYAPRYIPQPAPQKAAPQEDSPSAIVSTQLKNLRAFLDKSQGDASARALNPSQVLGYIERQITPDIDFQTMTQMALGRLANRMTIQQRDAAMGALRSNFTSKLVEAMGDVRATRFTVGKTRRGASRGELVVPVRLDRWRGRPMTIKFRFYKSKDGWKVFDAEAGGQSAVLFYRGYFARQWRQG